MTDHLQNAKWHEITDPDGIHKKLFYSSKKVYEKLFSPEHCEDWAHFKDYILDTQARLKIDPETDPQDFYFVATIDSKVLGMALITIYRQKRLAFMSYFGVCSDKTTKTEQLSTKGALKIKGRIQGMGIEGILFEVEKIPPEKLSKKDKWIQQRIAALRIFQKFGARKISWLLYEQPKLELDAVPAEVTNLHLMFLSTSRTIVLSSIPRNTAVNYVDFVYNTFYLDGFTVTNRKEILKAKTYLNNLSKRVIGTIPDNAKQVPLGEVNVKPLKLSVLISYTIGGLQITKLLASFLEDMGIRIYYWDKDAPKYAGKEPHSVISSWIKKSDVIIGLVTNKTFKAWGMVEELRRAKDTGKHIIILLNKEMSGIQYREIKIKLNNLLGNIIYIPFEKKRFHLTLTAIADLLNRYYMNI